MEGFGRHFTFDGIAQDMSCINVENVINFLNKCPDEIGMTKITLPQVYEIGGKIIGFVMIAESHVSFHGDVNTGHIAIDVFSCEFFNYVDTLTFTEKCFPCKKRRPNFYDRGLEFVRT